MRLVSFRLSDGRESFGMVEDDGVRDAGQIFAGRFRDLRAVLEAGTLTDLYGVGDLRPLADVVLLPPIPNPDKILCVGLNYLAHILETKRERPEYPPIFTRYPSSLVGHGSALVRPKVSSIFDYEGELAVVIGKGGRHIAAAAASDHIAGYTCFNDGSIRDYQKHTHQFWPGKNFEASGSMGPWICTPDEAEPISAQTLTLRVNARVEQQTTIDDLAIGIPELIAYISTVTTLLPGDIIATGTPGGVGHFRSPPLYLEPGMVVDVEITGVGKLTNSIVDEV